MKSPSENLTTLPNIGKTLAEKLILADIKNVGELMEAGSENAFIRLKAVDNEACLSSLYAIEGAIQGIRWHNLTKFRKEELKQFIDFLNK